MVVVVEQRPADEIPHVRGQHCVKDGIQVGRGQVGRNGRGD